MAVNPPPIPLDTPLVEENRIMNWIWVQWFTNQNLTLSQSPQRVVDTSDGGAAAIGATPLNLGTSGGLYRVNVIARITTPGTVSSSLTPTFRWTSSGVPLSRTYTPLIGNLTTTILLDVFPARLDANTSLTYETAYATSGATPMSYVLEMAVERLA